jgi:hypothetical protein
MAGADTTQACGNAFDTGFVPPPFEGFGACDTNAGMGLCEDPAVSSLMSEGCKLACGLCPADAPEIVPVGCAYNVHITTGGYADEVCLFTNSLYH